MRNYAYVTTNFTGRKFMCISLEENPLTVEEWANAFKVGSIYYECMLDSDGKNLATEMDDVVLLMDDDKNVKYADQNQFIEVEGMHSMLNNMWIGLN